jgi:hypothetical protein
VSLLEPEELGEELGALEEEDEEPDGLLFRSDEPDIEPELDPGAVLEPEDEDEPEGEAGRLLLEDPLEDLDAPGPPALSQPYRPVMATAIGRRTRADFLNNFIGRLLSLKVGGFSYGSKYRACPLLTPFILFITQKAVDRRQ